MSALRDPTVVELTAAFKALAELDLELAIRTLAQLQIKHYSQKPWHPGDPMTAANGQEIVYAEALGGARYTVHHAQENGSHVRRELGEARFVGRMNSFVVRAQTDVEAELLGSLFARARQLKDVRLESRGNRSDGWVFIRYSYGRAPLD